MNDSAASQAEVPRPGGPPARRPPEWQPHRPGGKPSPQPSARPDPWPAARPLGTILPPEPGQHPDRVADALLDRRIVLLSGPLEAEAAHRAVAALMSLDADGDDPVQIRLSAEDADLTAALTLADTIDLMGVPVEVTCVGLVGGPALAVLAAADHRRAAPHARFRMADPVAHLDGRATTVSRDAEAFAASVRVVHEWVARATGRTVEAVAGDFRARRQLSAAEAAGYGLVDQS